MVVWVGGISKYSVHFVSKNERNIFLVSDINYFQTPDLLRLKVCIPMGGPIVAFWDPHVPV